MQQKTRTPQGWGTQSLWQGGIWARRYRADLFLKYFGCDGGTTEVAP
jgi:hypothetical protein